MEFFLQLVLNGLVIGSIYALVGLGFVIIYKSSNVFNFAMGEMMMFGAYLFFAMTVQMKFGWPIAIVAALAGSVVLAVVMDRVLLQPLLGQPVIILVMVTLGGLGNIPGAIIAAIVLTLLPEFLRMLATWTHYEKLTEWRMTIYSLLLIGMMLLRARGLPNPLKLWRRLRPAASVPV